LVWFAEHPSAKLEVQAAPGAGIPTTLPAEGWAHVFVGRRTGARIDGDWADVPKGAASRNGTLSLVLDNPFTLRIAAETGGFGGRTLWRYESLAVDVDLTQLEIREAEDISGDEPKLHMVLAKVDGDGVNRTRLASSSALLDARDTGKLASDASSGTVIALGDGGRFRAVVKTILGTGPTGPGDPATLLGLSVGAWELDESSTAQRRTDFTDWRDMLQRNLDLDIRRGRTPDFLALAGRRHFMFGLGDDDDYLGDRPLVFRYPDLERISGSPDGENFVLRMTGDDADYRIPGTIRVRSRLNSHCAR
jgi:hypothetical protein